MSTTFSTLPSPVFIGHVFAYLSYEDLSAILETCRYTRAAGTQILLANMATIFKEAQTSNSTLSRFIYTFVDHNLNSRADCHKINDLIIKKIRSLNLACPHRFLSALEVQSLSTAIEDRALRAIWGPVRQGIMSLHPDLAIDLNMNAQNIRTWMGTHQDLLQHIDILRLSGHRPPTHPEYVENLYCLPKEIGLLTGLQTLHLSMLEIQELPSEIGKLAALRRLSVTCTKMPRLPPQIGQLTALTHLHFVATTGLEALPAEIGELTALTRLTLSGCGLQTLPAQIGGLRALTYLNLGGNQLETLPPETRERALALSFPFHALPGAVQAFLQEISQLPLD